MNVAIISDIHDHIERLRRALKQVKNADVLICCGDLCSPFIIKELGEGFPDKNIHVVFGNNDADLYRITLKAAEYENIHLHGEFCELTLGGKHFAVNHFDNIGRALVHSEHYDVVCFGHNHEYEVSRRGKTLIINPGEIMGELTGESTCALYNTVDDLVEKIEL